jgi:hypothetical protein
VFRSHGRTATAPSKRVVCGVAESPRRRLNSADDAEIVRNERRLPKCKSPHDFEAWLLNDPPEELVYDRGRLKTIDVGEARLAWQLDHHARSASRLRGPRTDRPALRGPGRCRISRCGSAPNHDAAGRCGAPIARSSAATSASMRRSWNKKPPSSGARALGITLLSAQYTELAFRK